MQLSKHLVSLSLTTLLMCFGGAVASGGDIVEFEIRKSERQHLPPQYQRRETVNGKIKDGKIFVHYDKTDGSTSLKQNCDLVLSGPQYDKYLSMARKTSFLKPGEVIKPNPPPHGAPPERQLNAGESSGAGYEVTLTEAQTKSKSGWPLNIEDWLVFLDDMRNQAASSSRLRTSKVDLNAVPPPPLPPPVTKDK